MRGGSCWRLSSVQAAAGYRRPPQRPKATDLPDVPRRRRMSPTRSRAASPAEAVAVSVAANRLGLSRKRVRQLVGEGRLATEQPDGLTVMLVASLEAEQERRGARATPRGAFSAPADLALLVAEAVRSAIRPALESAEAAARRLESSQQQALDTERDRRQAVEAELERVRAEVERLEARPARRRLFGRAEQ